MRRITLYIVVAFLFGLASAAVAQERVPAPVPSGTADPAASPAHLIPPAPGGRQYQPDAKYTPLDAGEDAYRRAEAQRRWAIDRQLTVEKNVRDYNTWKYYNWGNFNRFAQPFVDAFAPPRVAWRIRRGAARRAACGPVPPPFYPSPVSPDAPLGYNYLPFRSQPVGHEKTWTSPNSYIYKPVYTPPNRPQATIGNTPPPGAAAVAPPTTVPPPAPAARSENPLPQQPLNPANRPSGPREF